MIWFELLIFDVDDTPLPGSKCITSILATLTLNGGEFQNDGTITLRAAIGPGNSLISAYICVGQRERLFRGLAFPQAFEAVAKAALQRRRRIRIERHQIPQRLASIPTEPGHGRSVGVRVARHILSNRPVTMLCQVDQALGIGPGR